MIEKIPPVMARAILDVRLERLGFSGQPQNLVSDLLDASLMAATDVVGLANATPPDDGVDSAAMVGDVQPFPPVRAVPIERKRNSVDRIRREERDHFLRKLPRTVVIAAYRDRCRDAERVVV